MDNISKIKDSADKVNKLYGDLNYYDTYGGSVILFIILIVIMLLVFAYTTVMINIQPIKDNWAVERCNPKVIPFAGFINKPEGESTIQYTQDNFNYCMQNILTSITGYAVEPLTFITAGLTSLYAEIADTLNSIRTVISNVRTNIAKIAQEILGRILNIMTPIQMILISFIDVIGKIKGIFAAGIYTSLGTYYTLKSLMGAILQFVVIILMILAGLIAGLWIIPFTWPAAITGTAVFLSVSIPLLIILVFMNQVLHVDINSPIPSLRGPGHCFDRNTQIELNDGTIKTVEEIKVGDILKNNNVVTAKLKLDAKDTEMYKLGNVIVSGSHQVKYKNKWIFVKEHPERKSTLSYIDPYIYCLNTSLKTLEIDAFEFSDWDEIFDHEKMELLAHIDSDSTKDIHKYYDGGFFFDAKVDLENEESREISNLEIGSVLKDGSKVVGLVEILSNNLGYCNKPFRQPGINIHPIFPHEFLDLEKGIQENKQPEKLYHLLTDKNSFYVNGIKYFDYNSHVELFLEKYRGKLLSMKYV